MPAEIAAVYLDFDWKTEELWALDIEPETIARTDLDWHLDLPFWSSHPPEPLFDLVPRRVLENPTVHRVHAGRIEHAELRFPIHVMQHRGRLCIMDGMHRLAKAALLRRNHLQIRRVSRERLAPR